MRKHNQRLFWMAAFLMLALAACSPAVGSDGMPGSTMMGTEIPAGMATQAADIPMTSSEIDAMFINMMVPHHQGAVEMAKTAQERSQRPEIQEMAKAIIASQAKEIDQMKAWKEAWYGSSETPPMSAMPMMEAMEGMGEAGHPMDMQAEVDALKNAPEPFDLAFIDAMIPHHQSAIDAANMVLDTAKHPELRALAQQVIDAQQKEIDQMKEWRQAWFPNE